MTPGSISVNGVGKRFRSYPREWRRFASWLGLGAGGATDTWVLRDVSFDIRPGEAVGIVGRNGAGKSTLLKLLTGVMAPTTGTIHVSGRVTAILELGMGFSPDFTGRQNAVRAAGLMGYNPDEINGALPDIERFAEIGHYFDQPMRTLSSGMQMRVAFAVATAFSPHILIIDEALSVGDLYFQAKCFDRIARMKAAGCTFILVSHSVGDIVKHCERALFIRHGSLAADGAPREVTNFFLDHLFGKEARPAGSSPADDGVRLSASDDVYSTRPGYRPEEHRWGTGGARIVDYCLRSAGTAWPNQIDSNAEVRIIWHVVFDRDVERPVYGILVKTHDGIFLYGTNSDLLTTGRGCDPVKSGEVVRCEFTFPMDVNCGGYLLSLGVSENAGMAELVPLDRRYDSILVSVSRPDGFWGISDLRARFSAEKL